MSKDKTWIGSTPKCDLCGLEEPTVFYDGKTYMGPWAMMCPVCFARYGIGTGTGRAQKYSYAVTDKKWHKVEE